MPAISDSRAGRQSVIHVAESFASGVRAAISEYVRSTPELTHHLVYAPRADAPMSQGDLSLFETATPMVDGHMARVRQLRALLSAHPAAVVHGHSSFGGAYVRLASSRRRRTVVYSPHCFAFERRDISRVAVWAYRTAEKLLSRRTSVFVVCSPREQRLAEALRGGCRAVFAPNIAPDSRGRTARLDRGRMVVIGAGRTSPQKDPAFFAAAIESARASGIEVEAVWAGGEGTPELEQRLVRAGVDLTGWLSPDDVIDRLADATVYLHTAAWEGFPVSVLEAASVGLPVIVRDAPCFEGWGFPFVIQHPEDLSAVLSRVVAAGGDHTFGSSLLSRCSRQNQRAGLLKAYLP